MLRPVLFSCACIVGMSAGWPADTGVVIKQDIRLDGPEALARLQASNPDHYARAERILAAMSIVP